MGKRYINLKKIAESLKSLRKFDESIEWFDKAIEIDNKYC